MGNLSDQAISEIDGGNITLPNSLFSQLERSLKEHPDRTAVIVAHQHADHLSELADQNYDSTVLAASDPTQHKGNDTLSDCLHWSYRALHNTALHFVAALNKYNIQPGARVAHFVPNGIEWAILSWSCMLGKFTQAALDPGMLSSLRLKELQNILEMLQPDVIVVPDKESASAVDLALIKLDLPHPHVKLVLASQSSPVGANGHFDQYPSSALSNSAPSSAQGLPTWDAFATFILSLAPLDPAAKSTIEATARFDDLSRQSMILFTSGTTTGVPKGCPRNIAASLFTIEANSWGSLCKAPCRRKLESSSAEQIPTDDEIPRNAMTSQNFRIIAPALANSTWNAGGTVIMPSMRPDPGALLKAIARFELTMVLFIPAGLHAIVNHPKFAATNKSSIKTVILGGDMVTRDHYVKAARAFPGAEVIVSHGMTEGGGAFYAPYMGKTGLSILEADDESILPFHNSIGSLGKVNIGTRVRFASVDGTSNKPVQRGELGELHFCSPSFVRAYLNNVLPDTFYQEVDETGKSRQWFKTGDLGIVDEEGWVWILGRKKDVIKRAGIPVIPAALESCLDEYLSGQSAVLGLPHPVLGQEPFAVVGTLQSASGDQTYTKEDVTQHINDVFGSEYALGGIATLDELGMVEFPVNATGKIVKRELEAPVAGWVIKNADLGKSL